MWGKCNSHRKCLSSLMGLKMHQAMLKIFIYSLHSFVFIRVSLCYYVVDIRNCMCLMIEEEDRFFFSYLSQQLVLFPLSPLAIFEGTHSPWLSSVSLTSRKGSILTLSLHFLLKQFCKIFLFDYYDYGEILEIF